MPIVAADRNKFIFGYLVFRRITALLQRSGWQVGKDRVERIWRREGLKRQKPRGRAYGSTMARVRFRPMHAN